MAEQPHRFRILPHQTPNWVRRFVLSELLGEPPSIRRMKAVRQRAAQAAPPAQQADGPAPADEPPQPD